MPELIPEAENQTDLILFEIPERTWAKFTITGPMPSALQEVNTWIWNTWLPENDKYIQNGNISVEWYSYDDPSKPVYQSGIWLPVKEKNKLVSAWNNS